MLDLVLKVQGAPEVRKGSFATLPARQYEIAAFLQGKAFVPTREIISNLCLDSSYTSVLIKKMCEEKVIFKRRKSNGNKWEYMYSLLVERFEKKTSGRGNKREAS